MGKRGKRSNGPSLVPLVLTMGFIGLMGATVFISGLVSLWATAFNGSTTGQVIKANFYAEGEKPGTIGSQKSCSAIIQYAVDGEPYLIEHYDTESDSLGGRRSGSAPMVCYNKGQQVDIEYNRSNPGKSRIHESAGVYWNNLFAGFVFMVLPFALLIKMCLHFGNPPHWLKTLTRRKKRHHNDD